MWVWLVDTADADADAEDGWNGSEEGPKAAFLTASETDHGLILSSASMAFPSAIPESRSFSLSLLSR